MSLTLGNKAFRFTYIGERQRELLFAEVLCQELGVEGQLGVDSLVPDNSPKAETGSSHAALAAAAIQVTYGLQAAAGALVEISWPYGLPNRDADEVVDHGCRVCLWREMVPAATQDPFFGRNG